MTELIKEGFTTLMRQTVGSCQTLRHARVPLAGEACPRAQASLRWTALAMSPPQSFPRLSGKNRTREREARELKKGKEQERGMMGTST